MKRLWIYHKEEKVVHSVEAESLIEADDIIGIKEAMKFSATCKNWCSESYWQKLVAQIENNENNQKE